MSTHRDAKVSELWSDIDDTSFNLEKLSLLCHGTQELKSNGYILAPLTKEELLSKLRCKNCGAKMSLKSITGIREPGQLRDGMKDSTGVDAETSDHVCEFHPGRVINQHFTCCQAHVSARKGCQTSVRHTAPKNHEQVLERNWTYYGTPVTQSKALQANTDDRVCKPQNYPKRSAQNAARKAVALDCEFGTSILNEPELIRITAIDFFTKQVLVDSLVRPNIPIKNYLFKYSGVTSADMRDAIRSRTCIFGRDTVRATLHQFVDQNTILVMHGGCSDMTVLRWIHPKIVDTVVLEKRQGMMFGGANLKNACAQRTGIHIRQGKCHNSHEDALATRELAIWHMNLIHRGEKN